MELEGHPVVRFDAWENDFTPAPLVAFIAELDAALGPQFKKMPLGASLHAQWLEKAKSVLVPGVKTIGFALAKHGLGMAGDQLLDVWNGGEDVKAESKDGEGKIDVKDLGERLNKVVEEALKGHSDTKEAIKAFKQRLAALIEHLANQSEVQLPICVFIDELDRCRPDYAIQLLEGIKHLFGVQGLYFVVATNIPELAHAVRVVYGSGFSADRYLKRFFDLEYTLPEPDGYKFATELMTPIARIAKGRIVTGLERFLSSEQQAEKSFPYIFQRYAVSFGLPLRDQQQVASILEAAILSLENRTIHIHFLMFLAMLYQKNAGYYHDFSRRLTVANLQELLPGELQGAFTILGYDDNEEIKITILNVAEMYANVVRGYHPDRPRNSSGFPDILAHIAEVGQTLQDLLRRYVDVIRRAGRFTR